MCHAEVELQLDSYPRPGARRLAHTVRGLHGDLQGHGWTSGRRPRGRRSPARPRPLPRSSAVTAERDVAAPPEVSRRAAHPQWCDRDGDAEFGGVEHASRVHRWRPSYEHEVAIVDLLRQVAYRDGGAEIAAATVRIDNTSQPGEVAMTAEDLTIFIDRLLCLRADLIAQRRDPNS